MEPPGNAHGNVAAIIAEIPALIAWGRLGHAAISAASSGSEVCARAAVDGLRAPSPKSAPLFAPLWSLTPETVLLFKGVRVQYRPLSSLEAASRLVASARETPAKQGLSDDSRESSRTGAGGCCAALRRVPGNSGLAATSLGILPGNHHTAEEARSKHSGRLGLSPRQGEVFRHRPQRRFAARALA